MFFVLSWWKPKWVHLDVICIIHTVQLYINIYFSFCSITNFWNWVGFEKDKRHTQAVQFLQLVVHMYFVPVKLFILEIKGKKKNLYWGRKKNKKLSGLSMWPCLDQVLSLASCWCQAIYLFFSSSSLLLLPLNDAWFLIFFIPLGSLCPSLHESVSGEGVGLGSSKLW